MEQIMERPASVPPLAKEDKNALPYRHIANLIAQQSFPRAVFFLASGMFEAHKMSPRTAALFATQQRWLLSHAAMAHFFRPIGGIEPGLSRRSLGLLGTFLDLASRNTAYTFFEESMKYGVIQLVDVRAVGHGRLAKPSPQSLSLLALWYNLHFQALDLLDDGQRYARFSTQWESLLPLIQPIVADALFFSPQVRAPGPHYGIFTSSDSGGWLMDRLIAGVDQETFPGHDRYLTDVRSITYLARSTGLSNTHASRKMAEAQSTGALGWIGRPGYSPMWISRGFYEEYAHFQAQKLVILEDALAKALAGGTSASQGGHHCE